MKELIDVSRNVGSFWGFIVPRRSLILSSINYQPRDGKPPSRGPSNQDVESLCFCGPLAPKISLLWKFEPPQYPIPQRSLG